MTKAPLFLKKYFWDIDFKKLDPDKRATYVIERILEVGDIPSVRWVFKHYPQTIIKKTICQSPALSKKTGNFWSLILNIPKDRIRCLQTDFQKTQETIWPY